MTILQQIKLCCPVCDARFESLVAKVAKPIGGRRSDFRGEACGKNALPYLIHACPTCGYAGQAEQFKRSVELAPQVRDRVWTELAPRVTTSSGLPIPMSASEKYESAAKIAEWQHAGAHHVAELWLCAAWCCEDENDTEAERYFRRKAAWAFEHALESYEGITSGERAAFTYLVGELWRRIGDEWQAAQWFRRVTDEIIDFKAQEHILAAAKRQAEEPEEWLP